MSLNVPSDVFSTNTFKALSQIKSKSEAPLPSTKGDENREKKDSPKDKVDVSTKSQQPLVTVSTVSEKEPPIIKKTDKPQTKADEAPKKEVIDPPKDLKNTPKETAKPVPPEAKLPASKPAKISPTEASKLKAGEPGKLPGSDIAKKPPSSAKDELKPQFGIKDASLFKTGEFLQPSLVKLNISSIGSAPLPEPKKETVKPPPLRIDPMLGRVVEGPAPHAIRPRPQGITSVPNMQAKEGQPPVHSFKQPRDQTDLQSIEIVRRPRVTLEKESQDKLDDRAKPSAKPGAQEKPKQAESKPSVPPAISVIPSTPAGSDTPTEKRKQMISTTKQDGAIHAKIPKQAKPDGGEAGMPQDSAIKDQPKREAPKAVKEESKSKIEQTESSKKTQIAKDKPAPDPPKPEGPKDKKAEPPKSGLAPQPPKPVQKAITSQSRKGGWL